MDQGRIKETSTFRGLFADEHWQCDCRPRLRAKFKPTKNEGENHGRWYFSCPMARGKGCGFFLWEDEAEERKAAILNNSRTEAPSAAPQTPAQSQAGGYMTPETSVEKSGRGVRNLASWPTSHPPSRSTGLQAHVDDDEEELYGCSPSKDVQIVRVVSRASIRVMPPPETPHKAAKTDIFSRPGKRRYEDTATESASSPATLLQDDDDDDPLTRAGPRAANLFRTDHGTPTPARFHDVQSGSHQGSDLATEILGCLSIHQVSPITPGLKDGIRAIGERHHQQMSRAIAALKKEVRHLKLDLEMEQERVGDHGVGNEVLT